MPKIASSNHIYPLFWLDYKEEAVPDHGLSAGVSQPQYWRAHLQPYIFIFFKREGRRKRKTNAMEKRKKSEYGVGLYALYREADFNIVQRAKV